MEKIIKGNIEAQCLSAASEGQQFHVLKAPKADPEKEKKLGTGQVRPLVPCSLWYLLLSQAHCMSCFSQCRPLPSLVWNEALLTEQRTNILPGCGFALNGSLSLRLDCCSH